LLASGSRKLSDRIGAEGIVAFVTNNSFLDQISFDGMRQHLEKDFDQIYVFDLGTSINTDFPGSGNVTSRAPVS